MEERIDREERFGQRNQFVARLVVSEVLQVEGYMENSVDIEIEDDKWPSHVDRDHLSLDLNEAEQLRDVLDRFLERSRSIPSVTCGDESSSDRRSR